MVWSWGQRINWKKKERSWLSQGLKANRGYFHNICVPIYTNFTGLFFGTRKKKQGNYRQFSFWCNQELYIIIWMGHVCHQRNRKQVKYSHAVSKSNRTDCVLGRMLTTVRRENRLYTDLLIERVKQIWYSLSYPGKMSSGWRSSLCTNQHTPPYCASYVWQMGTVKLLLWPPCGSRENQHLLCERTLKPCVFMVFI